MVREEFLIQWDHPMVAFGRCGTKIFVTVSESLVLALRMPYLLGFTSSSLEVWHVERGLLLQVVNSRPKLLSTSPEIIVRLDDGRVVALQVSADEKPFA